MVIDKERRTGLDGNAFKFVNALYASLVSPKIFVQSRYLSLSQLHLNPAWIFFKYPTSINFDLKVTFVERLLYTL